MNQVKFGHGNCAGTMFCGSRRSSLNMLDMLQEQCNSGPWPLRIFRRAFRWSKASFHTCFTKLKSFISSLPGIKKLAAARSPAKETARVNVDKWMNTVGDDLVKALIENEKLKTAAGISTTAPPTLSGQDDE